MDKPLTARFLTPRTVDGDTLATDLVDLGYHTGAINKIEYRLHGLDCPEKNRPLTRVAGLAAKAFTEAWVVEHLHGGRWAYATTIKVPGPDGNLTLYDSFGRYIAIVGCYVDEEHPTLNQALLDSGHAVPKVYK